jgi:hypothetical protein
MSGIQFSPLQGLGLGVALLQGIGYNWALVTYKALAIGVSSGAAPISQTASLPSPPEDS